MRRKRRGRNQKREPVSFLLRYLRHELPSLYALARLRKVSDDRLGRRLSRSRNAFLRKTPWPKLPSLGSLILVADAMVCSMGGTWWTVYLMLLRRPNEVQATIAVPYWRVGAETQLGWREALGTIPEAVHNRIRAVVCDGHVGLVNYAKWERWIIQRCHFHLIAAIQGRRSKRRWSRHRAEGTQLSQLVHAVLTGPEGTALLPILTALEELGWDTRSPQLRRIIAGFVNHYQDYRSYLIYPELQLPRTTNAVESLIGMVHSLRHRARGFRSINSLQQWTAALIKHKRTMTCNGYRQPNYRG